MQNISKCIQIKIIQKKYDNSLYSEYSLISLNYKIVLVFDLGHRNTFAVPDIRTYKVNQL